jgi:hypothetical protein
MRYKLPDKSMLRISDPIEFQIMTANEIIHDAMNDDDFVTDIRDKQAESMMTNGMSRRGNNKYKYSIPQVALLTLPEELRDDDEFIDMWVREHHPYLIVSKWWSNNEDKVGSTFKL